MGIRAICDHCKTEIEAKPYANNISNPPGWVRVNITTSGLAPYQSKTLYLCPACVSHYGLRLDSQTETTPEENLICAIQDMVTAEVEDAMENAG